jgi:cell division protein FtsQ
MTRVTSPTIIWFAIQKCLFRLFFWGLICAAIGGTGYGVWRYLQQSYLENPEYQLRIVKLNLNSVMNEADVVRIGGIPLNTSIFGVDVAGVEQRLKEQPAVVSAAARRELPATIVVEIQERVPYAWIECPAQKMTARTRDTGHLIDKNMHLYPCPPMQYDAALVLPVIVVAAEEAELLQSGKIIETKAMKRAVRLLDIAGSASNSNLPWIDRIEPHNYWAMKVQTRDGIEAVFGLEDHERQMENLLVSMKHAAGKGMQIASINLIPEKNIPVVLRSSVKVVPQKVKPIPIQSASIQNTLPNQEYS